LKSSEGLTGLVHHNIYNVVYLMDKCCYRFSGVKLSVASCLYQLLTKPKP